LHPQINYPLTAIQDEAGSSMEPLPETQSTWGDKGHISCCIYFPSKRLRNTMAKVSWPKRLNTKMVRWMLHIPC